MLSTLSPSRGVSLDPQVSSSSSIPGGGLSSSLSAVRCGKKKGMESSSWAHAKRQSEEDKCATTNLQNGLFFFFLFLIRISLTFFYFLLFSFIFFDFILFSLFSSLLFSFAPLISTKSPGGKF